MPNRAAIVTGASSGIGLAIAKVLAEEGFALTVASRTQEKIDGAAQQLAEAGACLLYTSPSPRDS